jgi:hypothetical protein
MKGKAGAWLGNIVVFLVAISLALIAIEFGLRIGCSKWPSRSRWSGKIWRTFYKKTVLSKLDPARSRRINGLTGACCACRKGKLSKVARPPLPMPMSDVGIFSRRPSLRGYSPLPNEDGTAYATTCLS